MDEWKVDELGKRYRMIGNCKEYEPTINGIPQSVFFASQRAQREQTEAERARQRAKPPAPQPRCPFSDGLNQNCAGKACALHTAHGCSLAYLVDRAPAVDTAGKRCPFSVYACTDRCSLYKNGCVLTAI